MAHSGIGRSWHPVDRRLAAAGHKAGLILKGALMLLTMRHYKGKIGEKCRLRHFTPSVWPPYVASRSVIIVNRLFTMIGEL